MKSRTYVLRIIGFLCLLYSLTLLPPLLVSFWYQDGEISDFLMTFLSLFTIGALFLFIFRTSNGDLQRRDGFLIVALFWLLLSMVSSLPFIYGIHISFIDALFEATSGFTTTGSTIFSHLELLPPSILYYRQQLQFLGGLGLIVFAIAILPILGVGGAKLYRAETPGPIKDAKLSPRLAHSVRSLLFIYVTLMLACASAYWLAGMGPLEALEHSFATISTGGFSTHDGSLGYFHSHIINLIAIVFMILGAINFGVHFLAFRNKTVRVYLLDKEVSVFLLAILSVFALTTAILYATHQYSDVFSSLEFSLFTVASVITSTGFHITNFSLWPLFLPILIIFISFVGGCSGSTAGGIKVIRIIILLKQGLHQAFMYVHPKSCNKVKIGRYVLDDRIMQAIWGYFTVYVVVFVLLTLLMMLSGLDQVSAFAAIASSMNNLGPGLGQVSSNFADVSASGKLIAVFAMLLGRLEMFTLLVILTPEFWHN
jgi:trk system potassium uptake protein TrkH